MLFSEKKKVRNLKLFGNEEILIRKEQFAADQMTVQIKWSIEVNEILKSSGIGVCSIVSAVLSFVKAFHPKLKFLSGAYKKKGAEFAELPNEIK